MFFSDPILDMQITLGLIFLSLLISLIVFLFKRNFWFAVILFSVLSNVAVLLNVGSRMFQFYHLLWMYWFLIGVWPLINLFSIIFYVRKQKV
ncbi:MAG: hypothetical protein KBC83_04205 [Candidatus Moranbacteria bacterium]|jgi:hypothetical protein|nr:hypothetical protein [Candidatus Moranbacteria bacterium]